MIVAAPAGAWTAKAETADRFAPVRAVIAKTIEDGKVPSVAVAVVKDGRIIWEEGFGWADKERRIKASASTAYSLASITKPITATAVMQLNEAGKMDLDAPIERYLGGIRLTAGAGPTANVTARRIMAHSAGLPTYGHFYLDGRTPAGSKETISKFGMTVYPANTRFEYSNIGMKILDAAIEQVSGRSFGNYLRNRVFGPLLMKNSAVGRPVGSVSAVRYDKGAPMPFYLTDHPGSGDVWASAHDMAQFLAFHGGTPLPGQKRILSGRARMAMQVPASAQPTTIPGENRTDVGANWMISRVNGHPQIWHSGGQPGTSTYMAFYPEQKLGIVVLANASAQLFPITQAIRLAVAPEVAPSEDEPPLPPPLPVPYRGTWNGIVKNYAGVQPISMTFADGGKILVRLADQEAVELQRPSFIRGSLSGLFGGKSNLPEAGDAPGQFAIDLVQKDGVLMGELVMRKLDAKAALLLPSFVRLEQAGGSGPAK